MATASTQELKAEALTFSDIMEAYKALEPLEKMMVNRLADTLEIQINQRLEDSGSPSQGKAAFNRTGALEVLAKLGIWMVRKPKRCPECGMAEPRHWSDCALFWQQLAEE